ncbi:cytochrome o ubiquinol oxidase subunit 3 [Nitrosomonas eutropha]|uniref:cytochrome c oxidase subunit 3 n=1 Tax=Nitrosomonas eutropha TaxID=916 RepID=UPI0008924531|nr:cytochrome c oxidase subunit 3 [Nitrosomonas eutropha]SCX05437.1 cytochrome o ubiquinol oxidase subunit 3 [Nitrosomonas eutropha]SDW48582.1 cytochrome o ubiquinol oxidase subunit 3 [Nitrosomonas eutropha]
MISELFKRLEFYLDARQNKEIFIYPGLNLGAEHSDAHTQAEATVFGFWVFLMSDAIIFGMAFATYATLLQGTADGPGPRELYYLGPIFIETLLLLTSSFTFGMASIAMKYKHPTSRLVGWLLITLVLGIVFLGMELNDFRAMFAADGLPTQSGFLSGFFGLVPLHGLHVMAGCIWLVCMLGQIAVHGLDSETKLGLLRLALFWHFLDIVWIFIFSVVYLAGLA